MYKGKIETEEKLKAVEAYERGEMSFGEVMYYLNHFDTYEELKAAIEAFIHYYNNQRRQHKLNCLPPASYRSSLEAA